MKKIKLNGKYGKDKFAIVDEEDYDFLIACGSWYGTANGYAAHTFKAGGKSIAEYMHRVVLNSTREKHTDHINHDKLDNRRSNLRTCTNQQNMHNRKPMRTNKSGYKGVYKHTQQDKWIAQIQLPNRQRLHLISTKDIKEAAYVYDQAALQLFGDFASTNLL